MWLTNNFLVFLLLLLLLPPDSEAAIYRCKDADGRTTYSQSPCPSGHTENQMRGLSSVSGSAGINGCSLVRSFAEDSFRRIRDDVTIDELLTEYGGVNYVSPVVLNIISYINSFHLNGNISQEKVGRLAHAKCSNGGFGKFKPEDIPVPEIPEETDPSESDSESK